MTTHTTTRFSRDRLVDLSGTILMAQKRGEPIPEGWAFDAQGNPTTDPHEALPPRGTLAPLGGYKGSGLALVVEVLSSVLGGYPPENSSSFFGAFAIDRFVDGDTFFGGLERLVDAMKASAPADGSREVLLPGERGVPVSRVTRTCLRMGGHPETQEGLERAIESG